MILGLIPHRPLPAALRSGMWMMAAALSFTVMTTLIRHVATGVHPFEIGFFRIVVNLLLMLPFAVRVGLKGLRTDGHIFYLLRAVIGVAFLTSYFTGAAMIPVASSQALLFTAPLFAAVMAVLMLGEVIRFRRVTALLVGFGGALIILRPGMQEFSLGVGLVLVGALMLAASNVILKYSTRADHPDLAVFYLALYVTPMMLAPALWVWTWPSAEQFLGLIAIGCCATLNQRFLGRAFAGADVTAVLPFDFARLPFAAIIGYLVFAELPDPWVWVGGTVIFATSVYLAHREAKAGRAER